MSLALIDENLAKQVRALDERQQRRLKHAVSRRVVDAVETSEPAIPAALAALEDGSAPESRRAFEEMRRLERQWDDEYFGLQDEIDAGSRPKGAEGPPFRKARTAEVLALALRDDDLETLLNLLYVAHFALEGDDELLRQLIESG